MVSGEQSNFNQISASDFSWTIFCLVVLGAELVCESDQNERVKLSFCSILWSLSESYIYY